MAILSSVLLFALCGMIGVSAQNLQPKSTYCNINELHILCRYNPGPSDACIEPQDVKLSQQQKNAIVAKHNELRSAVALGKKSLPKAANMRKMVWDNELAAMAQRWADQCVDDHYKLKDDEPCQKCSTVPRFSVGENMATHWGQTADWVSMVEGWYTGEESGITTNLINSSDGSTSGHATQIIWATSYAVGCGIRKLKDETYGFKFDIVCDYGPAANLPGAKIYIQGEPGSKCPKGTKLEKNSGLCA